MQKLLAFLNNMDARAWRTVWVSLALLGGVGVMIVLGRTGILGVVSDDVNLWLQNLRESPWALPATIFIFVVTSFLAVPQFALAGGCIVAFGPWLGSGYAMIGTLLAGWLHFYLGRWGGSKLVERYGGNMLNRMSRFIGRNDFWASAIVRNVPTGPPIIVNMTFGASRARFWRFILGLAVGSVPKILVVALLGQSLLSAISGAVGLAIGGVLAVVGIWITLVLAARKAVRGEKDEEADSAGLEGSRSDAEPRQSVGRAAGGRRDHDAGHAPQDRP